MTDLVDEEFHAMLTECAWTTPPPVVDLPALLDRCRVARIREETMTVRDRLRGGPNEADTRRLAELAGELRALQANRR